jgi:hypothetical protein
MEQPYPFTEQKILDNKQIFSPCATSHWDPTLIYKKHLTPLGGCDKADGSCIRQPPTTMLPMDPRPWARISLSYKNSGSSEEKVAQPRDDVVYPFGGAKYPPTRYSSAIDVESSLYRLDRQLGRGDILEDQQKYAPDQGKIQTFYKPNPRFRLSPMTRELETPAVLGLVSSNQCMNEALSCNMQAVDRRWMHPTKMDKYKQRDGSCGGILWDYKNGMPPSSENSPTL